MDRSFSEIWQQIVGRVDGPLSLRFILQPAVATFLAVRAGLADARAQRPPYLWSVVSDPDERRSLLRAGFKDVAKVFVLALLLDAVYQYLVFHWIYPVQSLLVAVTLAIVPYALVRGPVTRLASRGRKPVVPQA